MASFTPKRILVPTDFSERSDSALRQAVDLAQQYGAAVHLLHVLEPAVQTCGEDFCIDDPAVPRLENDVRRRSTARLREQARRVARDATVDVRLEMRTGDPAAEVVNAERDADCDLVVLSAHGEGGGGRRPFSRVAGRIVRRVRSPVLLVRN